MSEEIKIVPYSIKAALADLNATAQSLETTFSKDVSGENILEMVDKMNGIKQAYEEILTSYQTLLTTNVEETRQAIESFVENERTIASAIQFIK
ncbi:YwqI/YxiC family protein [Lentibacillus sp. Marseille-P4043]|uniref:YwqI/YxiC family protein n=1 Tax=Lentibacillus sp. Marseille-P4043 TaxID=2040293 RepID=UPI000D0B4EF5|nr:YwqI/YxiC family protein [Lentibacillus sp. Marseille-P4043]